MPIQNGDHLRLTVSSAMPLGSIAQNVFYTRVDSTGGGTDLDVLADLFAWVTRIYTALRPIISDVVTQVLLEVAIQTLGGGSVPVGVIVLAIQGLSASEISSHGVAGQSNMSLVGGGRPSIKYWPGTNEAGLSNGEYLGFDLNTMLGATAEVISGASGVPSTGTYTPGIITGDLAAFKEFTGTILVRTLNAYQRGRKPAQ